MRDLPNRANRFFVGYTIGINSDWITNYRSGATTFVAVTWNSAMPYTSAVRIQLDENDDWFIAEEYSLQEHDVPELFKKAHFYFGMQGILNSWISAIGEAQIDTGYEIYSVQELVKEPEEGTFYIVPEGVACPKCTTPYATEASLARNEISVCVPRGPWDHMECDFCGVYWNATKRTLRGAK